MATLESIVQTMKVCIYQRHFNSSTIIGISLFHSVFKRSWMEYANLILYFSILTFKVRVPFRYEQFDDLTTFIFYIKRIIFVKYVFSLDCHFLAISHYPFDFILFFSFWSFITNQDGLQVTSNLWFRFSTRLLSYSRVVNYFIWHETFRKLLQISVSCTLLQFYVNSQVELSVTFMVIIGYKLHRLNLRT